VGELKNACNIVVGKLEKKHIGDLKWVLNVRM
jgi:hypothetical protein